MSDDGDRKFDPTPQRREQFRKEGKLARARDAGPGVAALAALAAIVGTHDSAKAAIADLFRASCGNVDAATRSDFQTARVSAVHALAVLLAPPILAAALGAIVAGAAQSGIGINLALAGFKVDRLDPIGRLKQIFSPTNGTREVLLALLKVAVVGVVAYEALKQELPAILAIAAAPLPSSALALGSAALRVVGKSLGATLLVALVDYAQSRFRLSREMKMTLKELKEEMRQEDGDPLIKAKIRTKARAASRRRMMTDVKSAAVVITNPTHVAVALRYDPEDPAPTVVAKGHDEIALAIRREARSYGIPIVENRRLARTLDAEVPLGKTVKIEHFAAVARVLAFVFKLRGAKPRTIKRAPKK